MRSTSVLRYVLMAGLVAAAGGWVLALQDPVQNPAQQAQDPNATPGEATIRAPAANPDITQLVSRLELEKYKATIKGLTQFGDRRQGTKRNRDAVDWIEAQLKSFGCTNTERIHYTYTTPRRGGGSGNAGAPGAGGGAAGAAGAAGAGRAGGGAAGAAGAAGGGAAGAGAAGGGAAGGAGGGAGRGGPPVPQGQPVRTGPGGSTEFGFRGPTGVYQAPGTNAANNPNAAGAAAATGAAAAGATTPPAAGAAAGTGAGGGRGRGMVFPPVNLDPRLRELNAEPATDGPRDDVFCTKIGTTHPEEMYIIGGHMDGHGWGEAANDDGSGTALVMEVARVFSSPDVVTDRSIRFALWNNEETGLNGAHAYVDQRKDLQGKEDPVGSGKYPEPKWLGMIQHDMMLWDHGMPVPQFNADGSPKLDANGNHYHAAPKEQRPEADVNIEFQSQSKMADASMKLAFAFKAASDRYATDYPANVGPHMTNTDSGPFMDLIPAISLRENERGRDIQAGWDPNWHQPSDVYTTYSDKDFKLGLNAAQTTLSALAQLTGMKLKK